MPRQQKTNPLWGIFKDKLEEDLPQRTSHQLQRQIELELQLEEQQSKKRLVSSYAQTEKKPKETGQRGIAILPNVNLNMSQAGTHRTHSIHLDEPTKELTNIAGKSPAYFDEKDLAAEPDADFSFTSLNQTVDTLALSRGLSQIRGNTLRIARQVRQKEKEREELIEQLRSTSKRLT